MIRFIPLFFLLLTFKSVFSVFPLVVNSTTINCYASYQIVPRRRPHSERVLSLLENQYSYGNTPLARHHIIPYATMRQFYNALLSDRGHFRRLYEQVLMVAASNVGLRLEDLGNIDLWRDRLEDLPTILQNHFRPSNQITIAQEVFVWLPFNILIGPNPQLRSDDQRSNSVEESAIVTVGELRYQQLRRMHEQITRYLSCVERRRAAPTAGIECDPTSIIDEMIDLIRTIQQPYEFNVDQWRIHVTRPQYAIATPAIVADSSDRELVHEDYCNETADQAFNRYNPPEFVLVQRSRRSVHKGCILKDEAGVKYDRFCVNSLNVLSELVKHHVLAIDGNELDIVHTTKPSDCNPALASVGGGVVGGLSAFGACLLVGGVYIPVAGWVGCAIGSALYGVAGATVASSVSVASCKT